MNFWSKSKLQKARDSLHKSLIDANESSVSFVGVGKQDGTKVLVVGVTTASAVDRIPNSFDGFNVKVRNVGNIEPH